MENRRWLIPMLVLSLMLNACGPTEPPRPGIDVPPPRVQSAAPVSQETPTLPADVPAPVTTNPYPTEAPTEQAGEMPISGEASEMYLVVIPEYAEELPLYAFTEVSFFITPSPGLCAALDTVKVDEIEVSLSVSLTTLDMIDADPTLPGIQLIIEPGYYPNPETLQILENSTDDLWTIHYHVKGVDYPSVDACWDFFLAYTELFRLRLRAVGEGIGEITIHSFVARTTQGDEIPVNYPETSLFTVVDIPSPTPTPAPATPEPVVTQPTPPTPTAPGSELPVIVPAVLQEGVYYRILPGENLFRIGLRFGVSWQTIARMNGIRDEHFVPAGMILYVPVTAPVGSSAYYIRRGDTLYSICRGLNLRVVDVAALNGIPAPYNYIRADTWLMLAP